MAKGDNTLPPRHGGYKPKSKSAQTGQWVSKDKSHAMPRPPKGEGGGSNSASTRRKTA